MRLLAFSLFLLLATGAFADDGELFRKDVSKTPDLETEHASLKMPSLYVPALDSQGNLTPIEYYAKDGTLVDTRDQARPLVAFYGDGHVESIEGVGFSGHGHRDLISAVSLDDGATWKRTNLSRSGDDSSFTLKDGTPYPGDVVRLFDAVAGNKVLAVWASRFCRGGNPNYAMDDAQRESIATHLGIADTTTSLYLNDFFGVSGAQKSSDFADEDYPEVGEVPYSCLWTARGTLEEVLDDNGTSTGLHEIVWRQAERLTSGVRDVHRMEAAGEAGVGFVVTWQEDPEGLRPGDGEGPGEGWSGAVAHHQTDIWYAYIGWNDFDLVDNDGLYGDPVPLAEFTGDGAPPVGVPMSIPVRLTDNTMCKADAEEGTYCNFDFDGSGVADFCADTVNVITDTPEGPDQTLQVCVTEDGRLLRGNIAATRARTNLRAYDSDGDGVHDSAWVITAYEESKGLGEEEFDSGDDYEFGKMDMGKNIWYHTFDMFNPELVSQGLMLNAPAVYPADFTSPQITGGGDALQADGEYMIIVDDPIYAFTEPAIETTLYQTEIARRFSLISQKSVQAGPTGTVAFATWKQGIIRQGGPADVMARRFVLPEQFDPATDNPFAYANMACENWAFTDGSNPRYVKGLCMDQPVNMSGTNILELNENAVTDFDSYLEFPWNDRFDDLDMSSTTEPLAKVTLWEQTVENFAFTSWDNPFDVAKGHRGYIDGDFIMLLYAWSPNWLANTVGHDNYNLYIRRSFDGGQSWTTLPASFTHTDGITYSGDGTVTCEWMGPAGGATEYELCTTYAAGDFEQARNVSQLVGTGETVLDPRYAPTAPLKTSILQEDGSTLYADDLRDPSKFFVVFETGDNTTVEFGEAEPLDLYYSRAFNWGDDYKLVDANGDDVVDPLPIQDDIVGEYFDWLEGSSRVMSGEASVLANPGGTLFYAIWNQEALDRKGNVIASDAWFRRVLYIDEEVSTPPSGGDDDGAKPEKPPKTKKVK